MTRVARGTGRGALLISVVMALALLAPATASAAHQIGQTGHPGTWGMTDRAAEPGAKCSYVGGGTAGSTYLTGIKLLHGPEITGLHATLRSVGYRPIIQHLEGGAWVTVKKGTLITGAASLTHPVALPPERTSVPVVSNPSRFRLLLRLFWYHADASVEGTRTVVVDSYVKFGGTGVVSNCKGRVITAR